MEPQNNDLLQQPRKPLDSAQHRSVAANPLNTSFGEGSAYQGADLQKANRQLAQLSDRVARNYDAIRNMRFTHMMSSVDTFIVEKVAPLLILIGLGVIATGQVISGVAVLASGCILRTWPRDIFPRDEYTEAAAQLQKAQIEFVQNFKDPLQMSSPDCQELMGNRVLHYALAGIAALTPECYRQYASQPDFQIKLFLACRLFDLKLNPFEYMAPALIKSEPFGAEVKTLSLLARLFNAAGDFSLNCFESDQMRFEKCFCDLKAHLDTIEL
jgi:hypothetical protein